MKGNSFKPSIAFGNEDSARTNIEIKIEFLTSICSRKLPQLAVAAPSEEAYLALIRELPDSKRKFNSLATCNLPPRLQPYAPQFGRNGPGTLRRNTALTRQVEQLNAVVRQIASSDQAASPKEAKKAALVRQLALANKLRRIAEATVVEQKKTIDSLKEKQRVAENEFAALQRETQAAMQALKEELRKARTRAGAATDKKGQVIALARGRKPT